MLSNITATYPGKSLVGINSNYGDTATLSNITIVNDTKKKLAVCITFKGNNTGAEPTTLKTFTGATGGDGVNCKFTTANVTYK